MSIGQRHLFSWLHLSDVHFGHGDASHGWDQKTVLSLLESDVKRALKDWPELPRPQAIMVTGDVAFSGGKRGAREYAEAAGFLQRLVTLLEIEPDRVFLVPGNHDVQRDEAGELVAQARRDPAALDGFLANPDQRASLLARQANYQRFAAAFGARDLAGWTEVIEVPHFGAITVLGLNTALLANDDADRGHLALAGEQCDRLATAGEGSVRLLLTHHPFEDGWLRDEGHLRTLAQSRLTVHLCGHVHDPQVNLIAQSGGEHHHVRVVAAAAHGDPSEAKEGKLSHGYNFASLMVDAAGLVQIRTWPRRWFPTWSTFRVDHLGVPDRRPYDDKYLGIQHEGSGLVLHHARSAGVHWWGEPEVQWNELLYGKRTLDVFGISLRTLFEPPRSDYVKDLLDRGGKVRVVLADPRLKTNMARYDEDFDQPLGDRTRKVVAVLRLLEDMRAQLQRPAALEVLVTHYSFKYSAYRLDGEVLFVPYAISPGKNARHTPALVFDADSDVVTRFLGPDLDELIETAQPVTPELLQQLVSG